jgi:hypothetical protein
VRCVMRDSVLFLLIIILLFAYIFEEPESGERAPAPGGRGRQAAAGQAVGCGRAGCRLRQGRLWAAAGRAAAGEGRGETTYICVSFPKKVRAACVRAALNALLN